MVPRGTILKEELESLGKKTKELWLSERSSTPHIAKEELFFTPQGICQYSTNDNVSSHENERWRDLLLETYELSTYAYDL